MIKFREFGKLRYLCTLIVALGLVVASCDDGSGGSDVQSGDTTAPVLNQAVVYINSPDTINLAFSEKVEIDNSNGFTVDILSGDGSISLTGTATGTGSSLIRIVLSRRIMNYETVAISYDDSLGNVRDLAGNVLGSISYVSIQGDDSPPVLLSAITSNAEANKLTATFNEPVELTGGDGFTVVSQVEDNEPYNIIVTEVSGSGTSTVTFTLNNYICEHCTAKFVYDSVMGNARDLSGNPLASFGSKNIVINDRIPPNFENAQIDINSSDQLVMQFSEPIAGQSVNGFTVMVDGSAVSATGFEISSDTLTLTLTQSVAPESVVTVEYVAASGTITDIAGNALESFGPADVTNDQTRPVITEVFVDDIVQGWVQFSFSEPVNVSVPCYMGFTLMVNGSEVSLYDYYYDDMWPDFLALSYDYTIAIDDTVTIEYDSALGTVTDMAGNELESFGPAEVTNGLPPVLIHATVYDSDPGTIELTFYENLVNVSADGFSIYVNDAPAGITGYTSNSDSGQYFINLSIDIQIAAGDTVTVQYDALVGTIADNVGLELESFGPEPVENFVNPPTYIIETFANGGGANANTGIIIYDSSFDELSFNDDIDSNPSSPGYSLYSYVEQPMISGETYYIEVIDMSSAGDYYSILVSSAGGGSSAVTPDAGAGEPNDSFVTATALTLDTVFDSCFDPVGESDFYVITMP